MRDVHGCWAQKRINQDYGPVFLLCYNESMKLSHHDLKTKTGQLGSALREGIFGLGDGVVSTLGAVTGIAVGTGSKFVVLLSGMVVIAVESLSMAAGSYLSSKSERELLERYLEEEKWEIKHRPKHEAAELREIYKQKGFVKKEIDMIVARFMKNPDAMLDEMAHHELKIIPENLAQPRSNALIMGVSYIVGGLIPLSAYFVFDMSTALWVAIVLSVVVLFGVGAYKTKLTHKNPWKSGFEMMSISLGAALIGYLIAKFAGLYLPMN